MPSFALVLLLFISMACPVLHAAEPKPDSSYDIVVYGGNCAGVTAAVQAAAMGKSVILISPDKHLGGLTSGGLGWVDVGNPDTVGGLAREYFHRVWAHYQKPESWNDGKPKKMAGQHKALPASEETMWILEPAVGERIFDQLVAEAKVKVLRGELLDRSEGGVTVKDQRITRIRTLSGKAFAGKMFIDATYEGDLMAAAKVSYVVGREANAQYGETLNGIRPSSAMEKLMKSSIDAYVVPGDPSSGLLPRVNPDQGGERGAAHRGSQAYNYRMCLTNVPANRVMVDKPEGYDEKQYEILFRALEAGLPKDRVIKLSRMPNGKTDSNNHGPVSTDLIGRSWDYPEADYQTREKIAKEHELWQRGLIWTVQNHPRVPQEVRDFYAPWGLSKDEFVDNNHWPNALYVRVARRLVGEVVVTEKTATGKEQAPDPVVYGSYHLDSHHVQYFVGPDGKVWSEGNFFNAVPKPYGMSYRALTPKRAECVNLLVPVCISSSYAAYGSIRMEPVFMMLGEVAATAAAQAIDSKAAVQDVPYPLLRKKLEQDGFRFP